MASRPRTSRHLLARGAPPVLVLVLVLAVAACGGDDAAGNDASGDDAGEAAGASTTTTSAVEEPTSATTAAPEADVAPSTTSTTGNTTTASTVVPADVPAFVVVGPDGARLVADGEVEPRPLPEGAELAYVFGDDARTTVVQVRLDDGERPGRPSRQVRVLEGDGERTLDLGPSPRLHDITVVDGARSVLVTRDVLAQGGEPDGRLVLVDLDTGEEDEVTFARAPEYEVAWASVAGDLVVINAYSDLTERIAFFDLAGTEVALASPTDDIPYAAPPLVVAADLTSDGSRLAWAEGPEPGDTSQPADTPWELLLAEPGEEATSRLAIPGTGLGDQVTRIDLRRRWALVSVAEVSSSDFSTTPSATWLFDLSVEGGAPMAVPVVGEATFVG